MCWIMMIFGSWLRARLQPYPETDYYTMCKDGLWGLMRSDGIEVLPAPRTAAVG